MRNQTPTPERDSEGLACRLGPQTLLFELSRVAEVRAFRRMEVAAAPASLAGWLAGAGFGRAGPAVLLCRAPGAPARPFSGNVWAVLPGVPEADPPCLVALDDCLGTGPITPTDGLGTPWRGAPLRFHALWKRDVLPVLDPCKLLPSPDAPEWPAVRQWLEGAVAARRREGDLAPSQRRNRRGTRAGLPAAAAGVAHGRPGRLHLAHLLEVLRARGADGELVWQVPGEPVRLTLRGGAVVAAHGPEALARLRDPDGPAAPASFTPAPAPPPPAGGVPLDHAAVLAALAG